MPLFETGSIRTAITAVLGLVLFRGVFFLANYVRYVLVNSSGSQ